MNRPRRPILVTGAHRSGTTWVLYRETREVAAHFYEEQDWDLNVSG